MVTAGRCFLRALLLERARTSEKCGEAALFQPSLCGSVALQGCVPESCRGNADDLLVFLVVLASRGHPSAPRERSMASVLERQQVSLSSVRVVVCHSPLCRGCVAFGSAAGVGWISDCIRDQRLQAQLVYRGLDRDQLPVYLLAVKKRAARSSDPDILVLKEAKAEYTKAQ